jgi:hypothetical protein
MLLPGRTQTTRISRRGETCVSTFGTARILRCLGQPFGGCFPTGLRLATAFAASRSPCGDVSANPTTAGNKVGHRTGSRSIFGTSVLVGRRSGPVDDP